MFERLGTAVTEPPSTPFETVDSLVAFSPACRDDDGLLDVAVTAHKHAAFAQAAMLEALGELHLRFEAEDMPPPPGREPLLDVAADFAPAAGLAPGTAGRLVDLAVALVTKLPRTLDALRRGETDLLKARVVAEVTDQLDPASRRQVEDVGLRDAPNTSPRQLRRRLEAAAIAADPAAAEKRHQAARERRRVESYPDPDGMGTLILHGPAEKTAAVFEMVDHHARCGYPAGDPRSLDQRRFDALYDLLHRAKGGTGKHPGGVGELQIVIAASTLVGLNDRPALLKGYGPITAGSARELAKDARWRRLVTDPLDGSLLDVGTKTYRPPKRLERFVKTRDLTCVEPTCDRDARTSQVDHSKNFPHGPTARSNLGSMCQTGHNRKTRKSGHVEQPEPGVFVWTTRLGRRYRVDRKPLKEFTDDELEGDPPF